MKKLFVLICLMALISGSAYAQSLDKSNLDVGKRVKIGQASDLDSTAKADGYAIVWDEASGKYIFAEAAGGSAEGWSAEGDGIVFDSTTYTDGLTISDVNVTLDNTSISILNTDGVLNLDGSIAISESLSANDFWVTSDDSTIAFDDAVAKPQIIVNGTSIMELSESGVYVNILGDVDIDGSLTLGNILTNTGSLYYLIIDDSGNVYKQAM